MSGRFTGESCYAARVSKCWGSLTKQHWPKRSQGGKVIVALLCQGHHDAIDNGFRYEGRRLQNDVVDGIYRVWDRETEEVLATRPALKGTPA